ncbi:MAG: pseudouridine-5'-phosphate glycosidase, partial [Moorella sp. (in: Bacteria)]|nr:pseudouridine-5'-phosphate glycosidase [Moorella sp. (in: firmicutes)]
MTVLGEQKPRIVLVETALLGQGLPFLTSADILRAWRHNTSVSLVWLEKGRIATGNLEDFLPLRGNPHMERIGASSLTAAMREGVSGYLTASAVMAIAAQTGNPVVVTAGMGGIRGGMISDDLIALSRFPVVLVASAPKDTLDLPTTMDYLRRHGVRLLGR